MVRKFLFLFLLLPLFTNCEEKTTAGVGELLRPVPDSNVPFRAYREFADLEPLFRQHNDTTYVINFWATWCKPCVEELPHFQRLAREYADAPLRIVLVSLDEIRDITGKLPRFVEERDLDLPIVVLTDPRAVAWRAQLDPDWNGSIPMTIIYKKGLRFFAEEQFATYYDLEEKVKPLLP